MSYFLKIAVLSPILSTKGLSTTALVSQLNCCKKNQIETETENLQENFLLIIIKFSFDTFFY